VEAFANAFRIREWALHSETQKGIPDEVPSSMAFCVREWVLHSRMGVGIREWEGIRLRRSELGRGKPQKISTPLPCRGDHRPPGGISAGVPIHVFFMAAIGYLGRRGNTRQEGPKGGATPPGHSQRSWRHSSVKHFRDETGRVSEISLLNAIVAPPVGPSCLVLPLLPRYPVADMKKT
jgi:hypothetical protein